MLLQFAVENFLSFREKVVLSLVAAEGVEHRDEDVIRVEGLPPILRCAALYGANASGKSNLVKALAFARGLVLNGRKSGRGIGARSFKLDDTSKSKPSRFELEIYCGGRRYSYGFLAGKHEIAAEWLFAIEGGTEVRLFERTALESQPERPSIVIEDALAAAPERRQFLKFVAEGTRPNQLFSTELRERNASELDALFLWFDNFSIVRPDFEPVIAEVVARHARFRSFTGKFLRDAGTGILDVRVRRSTIDKGELPANSGAKSAKPTKRGEELVVDEATGKAELFQLRLRHQGQNRPVSFGLEEESDGTRRLLELAPALYLLNSKQKNNYIIDELDRSLHPLLTRAFVNAFLKSPRADSANQLLFTTHDTNLLSLDILSRDSIWFVEKDAEGASSLYSLAEYKGEQLDRLAGHIEEGYLEGRFGAIPFLGDPAKLGWIRDESK